MEDGLKEALVGLLREQANSHEGGLIPQGIASNLAESLARDFELNSVEVLAVARDANLIAKEVIPQQPEEKPIGPTMPVVPPPQPQEPQGDPALKRENLTVGDFIITYFDECDGGNVPKLLQKAEEVGFETTSSSLHSAKYRLRKEGKLPTDTTSTNPPRKQGGGKPGRKKKLVEVTDPFELKIQELKTRRDALQGELDQLNADLASLQRVRDLLNQ